MPVAMKVAFSESKGISVETYCTLPVSLWFPGKKSPGKNSFDAISLRIPSLFHSPRAKEFSLCSDLINLYNGGGGEKEKGGERTKKKKEKKKKKLAPDQPRAGYALSREKWIQACSFQGAVNYPDGSRAYLM